MKKIIFLIPVYNDWESLSQLLNKINENIQNIKNFEFKCIIINDCSSVERPNLSKPSNIKLIKIINMRENKGHARCNAFGLRYINSNEDYDYVIVMDSDGEDRPKEINDLTDTINIKPELSVVAKRVKRSEGFIFQTLYQIHKLITLIFTGRKINFGNYSCITKKDVGILAEEPSLWSSFSGTFKKKIINFNEINSIRGIRYFGPSKMSLLNLVIHSFSIIAVFKYTVFLRSVLIIILLSFLIDRLGIFIITIQFLLVLFNLVIYVVSMRESKKELLESNKNLLSIDEFTH